MNQKDYIRIVSAIFALITIGHAVRLFFRWEVAVAGLQIPIGVSWAALLVAGALAIAGFALVSKNR